MSYKPLEPVLNRYNTNKITKYKFIIRKFDSVN